VKLASIDPLIGDVEIQMFMPMFGGNKF